MLKRTCAWDACESDNIFARGLCPKHLKRAQRSGIVHEFEVTVRVCAWCGVEYQAGNRGGKKFCTLGCGREYRRDALEKERAKRLGDRECARCGDRIPLDARSDAMHCSIECQQGRWYEVNNELLRARAGKWKRDNWSKALEYEHKRRAVTSTTRVLSRDDLMERDGYRCYLCDMQIDPNLRHPHPLSSSLDHIVPISRGGEHSDSNVAVVHLRCNLRKGIKTPAEMGIEVG